MELPAVGDGTRDIRRVVFESWDAALEAGNAGSRTADTGLASVHDLRTGL
jgi:hypothetical protein